MFLSSLPVMVILLGSKYEKLLTCHFLLRILLMLFVKKYGHTYNSMTIWFYCIILLFSSITTPVMTYGHLGGLVNQWSLDLEEQDKQFLFQAMLVNAWDHILIENTEKVGTYSINLPTFSDACKRICLVILGGNVLCLHLWETWGYFP